MAEEIKLYKINPKEKLILPFYEGGLFCGNPSENDYKPVYIDFMDMLTNYKQDEFIAVVQGDSMKDMGYMPGDICIVSQNVSPKEGSIVIACIDGRNTMKLYHRDKKNGKIYLIPANKDYEPIVIDEEQKTCIQGVVTRCLKNAHDGVSIVKAVMKKNEEKELKNKSLAEKLLPIFYNNTDNVNEFMEKINSMKNKDITKLVAEMVKDKKISDLSCHRDLWKILYERGIYNASETNWNTMINKG